MPMRSRFQALVMLGALTVPAAAMPAVDSETEWEEEGPPATADPPPDGAQPQYGPPAEPAPAPPDQTPPPPRSEEQQAAAPTSGQWIYTQQYGWVWMPYADRYLYLPPYGPPYAFLYYPVSTVL